LKFEAEPDEIVTPVIPVNVVSPAPKARTPVAGGPTGSYGIEDKPSADS